MAIRQDPHRDLGMLDLLQSWNYLSDWNTSNVPECVTDNCATYSNLTDMKRFPNSLSQVKTYNVGNTIHFG